MPTNKILLAKAIKYLAWSLPLLFTGPAIIYNALMNKQNVWHYLVLAIGIAACLGAVYLIVLGLRTLSKSIFND